jgi:hypothetical protein
MGLAETRRSSAEVLSLSTDASAVTVTFRRSATLVFFGRCAEVVFTGETCLPRQRPSLQST